MLREFLSKIFSPPRPYEEPRVQHDDFERLKRHIPSHVHEEDDEKQFCDIKHGSLSQQLPIQTPLSRSVSAGASTAAYERYLQRNAAKADNWAEFDELLHPTIEPLDPNAKPAQFLSPEEQEALAAIAKPQIVKPIKPYLNSPEPENHITAMLVHCVEMTIMKDAQKLLVRQSAQRIKLATLASFEKKRRAKLGCDLSQRILRAWMMVHASLPGTAEDALRAFASSTIPRVRKAVASNDRIPLDCLWALAHDQESSVRLRLANNPNCTIELLETMTKDRDEKVARGAAKVLEGITG